MPSSSPTYFRLALLPLLLASGFAQAADQNSTQLDTVYVTAERQLQQSLGVSKITEEDLDKRPAVNDISEIIRTMPGVNLTANSPTGQHGNKRQIDIRGMGPENTLIMVDGRPVSSRNSARMTWRGERDTTGDSNWVPVEDIQSIEVIRGPAAARYGSGAAGGVVNIVTKKVSNEFHGSLNYFTNQPADSKEGATNRVGFNLSGPIVKDVLSFRLYGNYSKFDGDSLDINANANNSGSQYAGNEGFTNKDVGGRLAWKISPNQTLYYDGSYGRHGSIFNGDSQNNSALDAYNKSIIGQEHRIIYRQSHALTHEGVWDWGDTKVVAQYDKTRNAHCVTGLAGSTEGKCQQGTSALGTVNLSDSTYVTKRLSAEANIPFTWGVGHVLTVGTELNHDSLDDPDSLKQTGSILGSQYAGTRTSKMSMSSWAAYVEDNISISPAFSLVPTLRFDHNNYTGSNLSPGLNASYQLSPSWKIKGGIARAYKAPNLYQLNENYLLTTRGNGCPITIINGNYTKGVAGNCYLLGNKNLKPETSWNKEIGFEFNQNGYLGSLAYFRNDYKNKITAGDENLGNIAGYNILQWDNARKAVVEGFEGNVTIPFSDRLKWVNNFTYMKQSINKDTGNPLSIIPKFTINSTLSWQATDKLDAQLTFTQYGKQKARSVDETNIEKGALTYENLGSYGIWGVSAGYDFNKNVNMRMGINNIFDKQLYRSSSRGSAQTYNQTGRAIWGSMKVSF